MVQYTEWLHLFILHYPSLAYLAVFFGVILGGGATLFIVGFLAAQKIIPLFSFTVIGLLAVFLSDTLWFLLGKTEIINRIILHRSMSGTISVITEGIRRLSKGKHFVVFILAKFLVGTPIILIIYSRETRLKFRDFFYYNTLSILLWLCISIVIGFVSGLGFTYMGNIFHNIYAAIGYVLALIVIVAGLQLWFKKKFTDIKNREK